MRDRIGIYRQLSQRLQSDRDFKDRFLSQPKSILTEMGVNIPDSVRVEVHEDTARVRNFVIPVESSPEDESTASNPLFRKAIAKAHADASFKTRLMQNRDFSRHLPASGKVLASQLTLRVFCVALA